jgi:hypothetical protein
LELAVQHVALVTSASQHPAVSLSRRVVGRRLGTRYPD